MLLGVEIGNNHIQKFDKFGKFIFAFGKEGTGPGEFGNLHGIAIDSKGNLYVADTANNRIQKLKQN